MNLSQLVAQNADTLRKHIGGGPETGSISALTRIASYNFTRTLELGRKEGRAQYRIKYTSADFARKNDYPSDESM